MENVNIFFLIPNQKILKIYYFKLFLHGATDPCFRPTEKDNIFLPTDQPNVNSRKARNPKDLIGVALRRRPYIATAITL